MFLPGGPVGPGSPGNPSPSWPRSPFWPLIPVDTNTHNIVAEKTNTTNLKQSCCGAISTQFELQLVRLVQMPKHDKVSKWGHTCGTFLFVNGLLITLHSFSIMYNQDDSSVRYQVCTYFERCTLSRWSGNRQLHCGFVQLSNNSTHHIFDDFKTETRGF